MWSDTSTPPYALKGQCLVKHRDNKLRTIISSHKTKVFVEWVLSLLRIKGGKVTWFNFGTHADHID
jgi:hypothetical protein